MCWKYEDLYPGQCTDHMFWRNGSVYILSSPGTDPQIKSLGVLESLEDFIGAEIDLEKARPDFEEMMTKLHEKEIMKPKK